MDKDKIDEHLLNAYNKSENLTLIPVLKLIYITTGIDLYKDFKLECPLSSNKSINIKHGEIVINNTTKLYLDIVDSNYDLTTSISNTQLIKDHIESFNDIEESLRKELINIISYLSHSCLIVFNTIKEKYKELLEFHLTMADNTTIYLDYDNKKRLGVVFKDLKSNEGKDLIFNSEKGQTTEL